MLIIFGIIVILAIGTVLNIIFAANEPDDDIRDENIFFDENKTKEWFICASMKLYFVRRYMVN